MSEEDKFKNGCGPNERWVRIPSKGREIHSGLSRGKLYELINAGAIKSASLRRPGCCTGVRLIWLPSLLNFIERHAAGGDQQLGGVMED